MGAEFDPDTSGWDMSDRDWQVASLQPDEQFSRMDAQRNLAMAKRCLESEALNGDGRAAGRLNGDRSHRLAATISAEQDKGCPSP